MLGGIPVVTQIPIAADGFFFPAGRKECVFGLCIKFTSFWEPETIYFTLGNVYVRVSNTDLYVYGWHLFKWNQ